MEVGTICVLAMMQKAEKLDEIFVGGSGETGDAVVLVLIESTCCSLPHHHNHHKSFLM